MNRILLSVTYKETKMSKKLFAMEDSEVSEVIEMETPAEVGQTADAEIPIQEEVTDIIAQTDSIDEGMSAADIVEDQVIPLLEGAAEGEGLAPVAAEAIKIAIEAICARIGANPKSVYSLYATENFTSDSSRKANTKIALEGVGEFLKDLWKKIKAALTSLWAKVKAFWDKHISSLGQVKKALESMKTKVAASSGKFEGSSYIEEAPSSMYEAFVSKNDITSNIVKGYIDTHKFIIKNISTVAHTSEQINGITEEFFNNAMKQAGTTFSNMVDEFSNVLHDAKPNSPKYANSGNHVIELGSETNPLINGKYITINIGKEKQQDDDFELIFEIDKNTVDWNESKIGIQLTNKQDLSSLLNETVEIIKSVIKYKNDVDKSKEAFNRISLKIENTITSFSNSSNKGEQLRSKRFRKMLKIVYKLNSKLPTLHTITITENIKLAKAVLGYSSLCLKHYKAV